MSRELKPCPFCGGSPQLRSQRCAEDAMEAWVTCLSCFAETERFEDAYTPREQAIAAWNTRALDRLSGGAVAWRREAKAGDRMMEMIPSPIDLEVIDLDRRAACDLIGVDTYGQAIWTPETISDQNRVVQAFAKYRIALSQPIARANVDRESVRAEAFEEAAKVADINAARHAESFRIELVRRDDEKQTHYAARCREAEELAAAIRALNTTEGQDNG